MENVQTYLQKAVEQGASDLFIVAGILCFITYKITNDDDPDGSKAAAKKAKKAGRR